MQRFTHAGTPVGSIVDVDNCSGFGSEPDVAMNAAGDFVIVWRCATVDIFARKYDSNGSPQGSPLQVNESIDSADFWSPTVAMLENGGFVVAWGDNRNGVSSPNDNDIYLQRYTGDASPVGGNTRVSDDDPGFNQFSPSVACDSKNRFAVVWHDRRNIGGQHDVFGQWYDSLGQPLGGNVRINSDTTLFEPLGRGPRIGSNDSGAFVVVWGSGGSPFRRGVHMQCFEAGGAAVGDVVRVVDSVVVLDTLAIYPQCGDAAVSVDDSGRLTVVWRDNRWLDGSLIAGAEMDEIFAQSFQADGSRAGANIRVPDDHAVGHQEHASVSAVPLVGFVCAWQGDGIHMQLVEQSGVLRGANIPAAGGYSPAVAADQENGIVIAALENDAVFLYRFDLQGISTGPGTRVDQDTADLAKFTPALATLETAGFVVTWTQVSDGLGFQWDVYAQRYSPAGVPIGTNVKVNDSAGTNAHASVASVVGLGHVVAWDLNGQYVYLQLFDVGGLPMGAPILASDDLTGPSSFPAIASDTSGNILVAWHNNSLGHDDIYLRRFDRIGTPLGASVLVNDDGCCAKQVAPAVAVGETGEFMLTWTDKRNGAHDDVYAQRFSPNATPIGSNVRIGDAGGSETYRREPSVAVNGSVAFVAWQDNRRPKGWDIFGSTLDVSAVNVAEGGTASVPGTFSLMQNYPNPFNASTTIEYRIALPAKVDVAIYNVLGRRVQTVGGTIQPAGAHRVNWDGRDDRGQPVASGIYLYRLMIGDRSETRRMLLLK
jgi:hypothetical protein